MLPVSRDATNGPEMIQYLAIIAAWVGDKDLACEQLAKANPSQGYGTSYGRLKLLPFWDPLRGDPRFEKIVQSLAPETVEAAVSAAGELIRRRYARHHSGKSPHLSHRKNEVEALVTSA